MAKLEIGIFGHRSDAALAIQDLQTHGIRAKQISIFTKQKTIVEQISKDTGIGKAQTGLGNEGLFGTAKGLAAGLNLLPDSAVAAGPAARKLAGGELGEEPDADGLQISLMGIGIPGADAEAYARHADQEHIIVVVVLEEEDSRQVGEILARHYVIGLDT
ncbi:general stress protein [Paenibacillus donghaensis]|nr:general stress protein [Paenibacillus donghaensis]